MSKSTVCEKEEQHFSQKERFKMKRPRGKSSQIQIAPLSKRVWLILKEVIQKCTCFPFVLLLPNESNNDELLPV